MKNIRTPIDLKDISNLKIGDSLTISGNILTARDQAHKRLIEEGAPIELDGSVIFHAGPIIKKANLEIGNNSYKSNNNSDNNSKSNVSNINESNINQSNVNKPDNNRPSIDESNTCKNGTNYEIVAIGPTTSMRMNSYEDDVLKMGVKVVIGKGGMDDNIRDALVREKAVYLVAVGGCAALYVDAIKSIKDVTWLDLGMPEAIWNLEVENFGPLIVAMDSAGNSLFDP